MAISIITMAIAVVLMRKSNPVAERRYHGINEIRRVCKENY